MLTLPVVCAIGPLMHHALTLGAPDWRTCSRRHQEVPHTRRVRYVLAATTAIAVVAVGLAGPASAEDATPADSAGPVFTVTSNLVSELPGTVVVGGVPAGTTVTLTAGEVSTSAVADASGSASLAVIAWMPFDATITAGSGSLETTVAVAPAFADVRVEPGPIGVIPDPPALGDGPNPAILPISPERRASMTGLSWSPGCLPFDQMREVQINYLAPDGYRHRGVLITRANAAERVVIAFSQLYDLQYRIWSMHPVDVYGPSPAGPGANDYASMQSGNTSMFNCRYVVGREHERVRSPHAGGRALDLNPWENPYRSRRGPVPNSTYLPGPGRPLSPLVLTPNHPAVLLLKSLGWKWLAPRDYQHFDLVRRP